MNTLVEIEAGIVVGINNPPGRITCAEGKIGTGHLLQVEGHVLGSHARPGDPDDVLLPHDYPGGGTDPLNKDGIVHRGRVTAADLYLHRS